MFCTTRLLKASAQSSVVLLHIYMDKHGDSLRVGRFGVLIQVGVIFSPPVQTGSGACRDSCTVGTRTFSRGQSGRGVGLTILPYLPPRLTKGYSYTLRPLCAFKACYRVKLAVYLRQVHSAVPKSEN